MIQAKCDGGLDYYGRRGDTESDPIEKVINDAGE